MAPLPTRRLGKTGPVASAQVLPLLRIVFSPKWQPCCRRGAAWWTRLDGRLFADAVGGSIGDACSLLPTCSAQVY